MLTNTLVARFPCDHLEHMTTRSEFPNGPPETMYRTWFPVWHSWPSMN